MRKLTVVGMTTLMMAALVGIGYAQDTTPAPTGTPVPMTTDTTAPTRSARGWLGVAITDATAGITVERVQTGSAAATAGLLAGDVIVSVNGTDVATRADLKALVEDAAPGDILSLEIHRGEETLTVAVTLTGRESSRTAPVPTDPLEAAEWAVSADLTAGDTGYEVAAVTDRTRFDLAVGDVITTVNGTDIAAVDWTTLVAPTTPDQAASITLTVLRDGAEVTLEGQLGFRGGRGRGDHGGMGGMGGGRGDRKGGEWRDDNAPAVPGDAAPEATPESTSDSSSL